MSLLSAGSYTVDQGLQEVSLRRLSSLFRKLVAEQLCGDQEGVRKEEITFNDAEAASESRAVGTWGVQRVYFCDAEG